jgi:predicted metal-binding membrane protein
MGGGRRNWLTALMCAGYFFVWTVLGLAAFALGVAPAAIEMHQPLPARAVSIAAATVIMIAGAFQFTGWKARHLAQWREPPGHGSALPSGTGAAFQYGARLGLHCAGGCGNLMAILLVIGIMDVRAMAVVTAAIAFERLAPGGERVARAIGVVGVGAGVIAIARAAGLG